MAQNTILPQSILIAQEDNWKTFESSDFGFSIEYPGDLDANDYLDDKTPSLLFYNFDPDTESPSSMPNIADSNMTLLK